MQPLWTTMIATKTDLGIKIQRGVFLVEHLVYNNPKYIIIKY